jgi:hypothetical protein
MRSNQLTEAAGRALGDLVSSNLQSVHRRRTLGVGKEHFQVSAPSSLKHPKEDCENAKQRV